MSAGLCAARSEDAYHATDISSLVASNFHFGYLIVFGHVRFPRKRKVTIGSLFRYGYPKCEQTWVKKMTFQ